MLNDIDLRFKAIQTVFWFKYIFKYLWDSVLSKTFVMYFAIYAINAHQYCNNVLVLEFKSVVV